jgi:hypothetical protein
MRIATITMVTATAAAMTVAMDTGMRAIATKVTGSHAAFLRF